MSIKISRSKIDLFLECPKCFYLDKVLGVPRPPGFPFTLNAAVDHLLKKEFDIHRAKGEQHPLMKTYGIDAVPFKHEKMEEWRDARTRGIKFLHEPTDILVGGGIDDIWINSDGELHMVDYKATAKAGKVSLDAEWQIGYKRQVEVYQWLFRKNGFKINDVAFFVYVNGKRDAAAFDGRLEFDIDIIPYKGNDNWVEKVLFDIRKTLDGAEIPKSSQNCEYCAYRDSVNEAEK